MKRWLYLSIALCFAFVTSIIIVSSEGLDTSSPLIEQYPILEPFALPEDSIYSFRSGELYRAPFGGTGSLYNGTLTSALNELNVATIADVQAAAMTISDMVSALEQYFSSSSPFVAQSGGQNLPQILQSTRQAIGSFPYTATWYQSGGTELSSTTIQSLTDMLNRALRILSYNQITASGLPILRNDGSIVNASVNWNSANVALQGFAGLARRLSGNSGSAQFDYFAPGSGTSIQVSSIMDSISAFNTSNISASTMSNSTVLMPSGVAQSFSGRMSLAAINDYGFQGLATILRGSSSNGSAISWMDYSDLSISTSSYTNLFDLNAAGFEHMQNLFAQYMYSHGTDFDIKERENMQGQAEQFVDDFTSPGGKGTMSQGNMSDMANVSSSMGSNFSSSATVADIFTQLGSGNNYSFFSSDVLNDLEGNVPATVSFYDDGYFDFLSPHLDEFREGVGSLW